MYTHTHSIYTSKLSCRSSSKQEIQPPSHVAERYIELLCQYQPEVVYNFLRTNDNYRLEEALDVSDGWVDG